MNIRLAGTAAIGGEDTTPGTSARGRSDHDAMRPALQMRTQTAALFASGWPAVAPCTRATAISNRGPVRNGPDETPAFKSKAMPIVEKMISGASMPSPDRTSKWRLERVWEERNRTRVLAASSAIVLIVAVADWQTKPFVAFGFLYLFPVILAAGFLPKWAIALLGAGCAVLSELFSELDHSSVRLAFETLALVGCGLAVAELVRNRRLTLAAQTRLTALVETSPAAIVTVDQFGMIELANRAATEMLLPRHENLLRNPIAAFLPQLHHALRWEEAPQFRATMQCRGHRGTGETFIAEVWFSTYKEGPQPKLAAIIADLSEETAAAAMDSFTAESQDRLALSVRETEVLRCLVRGFANKQIATHLEVSESTVKNTLQQLFLKVKARTRTQLVRVALEQYRDLL